MNPTCGEPGYVRVLLTSWSLAWMTQADSVTQTSTSTPVFDRGVPGAGETQFVDRNCVKGHEERPAGGRENTQSFTSVDKNRPGA